MWSLIDQKMDEVMDHSTPESVGYLRGSAEMLAVFLNCYRPDVDAIRAEAMIRWERRNPE
jgi:hypothetical protein